MKRQRRRCLQWLGVGVGSLALAGCATGPQALPSLPVVMNEAPLLGDDDALRFVDRPPRVVVLSPEGAAGPDGRTLADAVVVALQALLAQADVTLVDRALAQRVEAALLTGHADHVVLRYAGPDVADFAVTTGFGTPSPDAAGGSQGLSVRIVALPSLQPVQSVPLRLTASGIDDALARHRSALLAPFAPKGWVTEQRRRGTVSIFRVAMRPPPGLQPGTAMEIVTRRAVGNGLGGRRIEEVVVARGSASSLIGRQDLWLVVDDERAAARVRRGDLVRLAP